MQKVNNMLSQLPNWLVTVTVALVVSYTTIQLKVNTLETRNSVIQERINQLDNRVHTLTAGIVPI